MLAWREWQNTPKRMRRWRAARPGKPGWRHGFREIPSLYSASVMSRRPTEHRSASPIASEAPQASEREIEYVYDTLRAIARRERGRNSSLTLNTTALVHEAWLKLGRDQDFDGERHCLGSYAMAIRQVLVDYIRAQTAAKRTPDDDYQRVYIERLGERSLAEVLELDRALQRLERLEPRLVRLVELRFFAGLTVRETSRQLGVSERTVKRDWQRARAYLQVAEDAAD